MLHSSSASFSSLTEISPSRSQSSWAAQQQRGQGQQGPSAVKNGAEQQSMPAAHGLPPPPPTHHHPRRKIAAQLALRPGGDFKAALQHGKDRQRWAGCSPKMAPTVLAVSTLR